MNQASVDHQASADLAKEMADAQLEEFGPDPGQATYPKKFFQQDVRVYKGDPEGRDAGSASSRVNPEYCANAYGASLVSAIFGGAIETPLLCPLNPDGLLDGWKTTKDTPYLIFERNGKKGAPINAGLLLGNWTHGFPGDLALQNAQREVDGSFA